MLLYIANLPFDIKIGRIRQLIRDECRIDDVILDNMVADKSGKRITVGLVDQEQASLVMAKLNGYFIDGHKLQVELVQKKATPSQPLGMKPFNQPQQPMLNNFNMMFQQPNYNMNHLFTAMPYYMAQQNLGNVRQPTPQAVPFPSFNKDIAGNWYAMNYGNAQYGASAAQSVQNVAIEQKPQKRSHDNSSGIPEKRTRCEQFGMYKEDDDHRSRPSEDRCDRERYGHRSSDRFDGNNDDRYTSRNDRYNSDDDRHRRDRYDSPEARQNRREERYNCDNRYDYGDRHYRDDRHNSRDDRDNIRDDRDNSRDDRHNSRDYRRNSRNDRYDNSGRYDSEANRSFDSERSTFDNSNPKSNRVVVWEKNPYKLDRRPGNAGNTPPKPLIPQTDKPGLLNKTPENYNNQQSFSSSQPILNKLLQISGNTHQQHFNNKQNFQPQSSNKPQQNYNNQQNFNKPQTTPQKPNNSKRTLNRKGFKAMQYAALNEIVTILVNKFEVPQEAYIAIRKVCGPRVKNIIEQHECTTIGQVIKHYTKEHPNQNDQELVEALREFGITDPPQVYKKITGSATTRQSRRAPRASAPSLTQPPKQAVPLRPAAPALKSAPRPALAPRLAPPTKLAPPKPNPPIIQPVILPRVPPLQPVPAQDKLPKYPNANKNVYREIKKQTQLEAKEDFSYQVDRKYVPTMEYELGKMREKALNACKEASTNDKIEMIRQDIVKNGIDKVMKAIRMHISKRLGNNFIGNVRLNFKHKGPKKAELEKFLKDYNVVSLKKSDRGKFYVATCNNSDGYDKLVEQGSALVDDIVLTIKPLNILGKPDKKEMLTKFQNSVNNMALKFQSAIKEPPRPAIIYTIPPKVTEPVKAQVTEEVKAQVTEEVREQVKDDEELEIVTDDVEIIYKENEVIEIKEDCDFSEDVVEIKDFDNSEQSKSQDNYQKEAQTQNSEAARNLEQELQNSEQESQNSAQESQILEQQSENTQNSEQDSQNTQNSEQESATQVTEQEQNLEELDLTVSNVANDELKGGIICNIDDEDLEDF